MLIYFNLGEEVCPKVFLPDYLPEINKIVKSTYTKSIVRDIETLCISK
ncbi:hypothetical protein J2X31_001712 [Flavobacterium arsenatis]|uniref:Uncharacterized protein n=1 Tax=Flavobacterium arsenatis TaxID=1484332 RepID=A0ABU1TP14_9FLAO|nr:hypothetical protein [Flavobacterium arsenatis]